MNQISVTVVRATNQTPDGIGGYTEGEQTPVPGSPFVCRLYRRRPAYLRTEGDAGTTTRDDQRILSFCDPTTAIQIGDIALLPPCPQTQNKEERVLIQHIRPYPSGLQCDIESGTTAPPGS